MKRLNIVTHPIIAIITLMLISFHVNGQIVKPTAEQQKWADAEIGVLMHFDMPVFHPDYNWRQFGTHPDAKSFNPTELNTDQWIATAKKLGAKYAILVAKHCSGFSLWPTKAHEYSIKNSPWKDGKGDIVKDFIASCHKYGIMPGIYASTSANGYLYVDNPGLVQKGSPVTQAEYRRIVTEQLTELWSNYGKLFEIWFDGGVLSREKGGADVLSLINRYQKGAIAFQGPFGYPDLIRWVGNEEGFAPYPCWATADSTTSSDGIVAVGGLNGRPDAPYWCPGESDFTLRNNSSFQGGWFWKAGEDSTLFNTNDLIKKYVSSVGRNTNMLLGVVINDKGLVPDADVARAEAFGNEIHRLFDHPIKEMSGKGKTITSSNGSNEVIYEIRFDQPTSVSHAVMQEEIAKGERVLSYRLEGETSGNWEKIAEGTNIGHKRIEMFDPKNVSAVRLVVTSCKAEPKMKAFKIY
mgnify:FL=1|jgi:alpha-L-fucosidase